MTELNQKIINAAEELFMQYGIKSVTMDDIANNLGISKKTLYQYVENKRDLVNQTIISYTSRDKKTVEDIINQSSDAIDEQINIARHAISLLRRMTPTLTYDLKKYYVESWKLVQSGHFSIIEDIIKKNLLKGIQQGLYRECLNPVVIAKLYVGKINLLIDENLFPRKEFNRDDLFREYIFYHLHGIVSSRGFKRLEELKNLI